jgi:hypothetical protein
MRRLASALSISLLGGTLIASASAQDLPKTNFKVLVQDSPSPQTKILEIPFWTQTVPAQSNNRITADVTPSIKSASTTSRLAAEARVFEVRELGRQQIGRRRSPIRGSGSAGIALDIDTARKYAHAEIARCASG